jgi:hypothetical protein
VSSRVRVSGAPKRSPSNAGSVLLDVPSGRGAFADEWGSSRNGDRTCGSAFDDDESDFAVFFFRKTISTTFSLGR